MRIKVLAFAASLLIISIPPAARSQTSAPTTSSPQAVNEMAQSARVLAGSTVINDVILTGTARRIAGSEEESGNVTLHALGTGETRMNLTFPSGQHTETHTNSGKGPAAKWSGPDGTPHSIPYHNLLVDSSWFFPGLLMQRLNSSQNVAVDEGEEVRDGHSVVRIAVSKQFSGPHLPDHVAKLMQHGSEMHIYIDSATLLPAIVTFNTHPDNDALRDIPVEIHFSDYRVVNGLKVPFHLEKYFNNELILDLRLETVVLNTGQSATSFDIQ